MFDTILIANRGEIACRIAHTARRLNVRTVAVHSEADRHARHVAAADVAVHIGPAPARDSYLDMDRILAAAKATGAQAIHPGYGFLSENEDFARKVLDAGLTFIGPPPAAIAAMGLKSAAKALMEKAGVPLVPGYHGAAQEPELLRAEAARIGYPVLIKASAGGGGKGMRVVERDTDFLAALASCQREARSAFGDDAVLVERYLTRPRHVEVQVFADTHGTCLSLFERDCSVQRRHQKVLEEAPAPGFSAQRRAAIGEAAVKAARAVGYVGAGTVEFIAEGDDFFFMEMNTRLQVEHPVTELVTGLDLVEWQLKVAAGERLPFTQDTLPRRGHAIEARVYAENPDTGFLPSTGTLAHLRFPPHVEFTPALPDGLSVRVDSGVRPGDAITPHYDPMIAKVIAWGPTREDAVHHLAEALAGTQVVGVSTNVAFLRRVLAATPFATGQVDTGLIARHHDVLFPTPSPPSGEVRALAAAALIHRERARAAGSKDPWSAADGFRLSTPLERTFPFLWRGEPVPLTVVYRRDALAVKTPSGEQALLIEGEAPDLEIFLDLQPVRGTVVPWAGAIHVFTHHGHWVLDVVDPLRDAGDEAPAGGLTAPMPGKIVSLMVEPGTSVARGAGLLVMEAMKMEHTLFAPSAGTVKAYRRRVGEQVPEGELLIEFEAAAPPP